MGIEYVPGLAGVPATQSKISFVDGDNGILEYRGVPIQDLVEASNYAEIAYLLMSGTFPTSQELNDWKRLLVKYRPLSGAMIDAIRQLPKAGHPMHALQAMVPVLAMHYEADDKKSADPLLLATARIIAALPAITATCARVRNGKQPVAADPNLSEAANFLWMLHGEKPSDIQAKVLDAVLVLHEDHSLNASTFAHRHGQSDSRRARTAGTRPGDARRGAVPDRAAPSV